MKFKIKFGKESKNGNKKHGGPIDCLDWKMNDELYSVGDDNLLYKWNLKTCESIEIAKLPDDFMPSDLHWLIGKTNSNGATAISGGSIGTVITTKGNASLLIASRDGRFIILNRNGSVETNIAAHTPAAITSCRWSPDAGSSLLTSSEDGTIKIWSRSGMLRSMVIKAGEENDGIRVAKWSPDGNSIIYCQSSLITIKPLEANSKLLKWKAHDGMVLCLTWSNDSQYIASGGEDCRYKVWDYRGTHIYTSTMHDGGAITSIEYSPNGQLLAVGSFNTLILCNFSGCIYNNTKFSTQSIGSIYRICWSQDSTQIAAGTSLGKILFAYVIEQECISRKLKAKTIGRKTIEFQNMLSNTKDLLDFSDRITNWQLGYGHLIVSTAAQKVYIYNEKYLNTPAAVIDGRYDVRVLLSGLKYFLIIDINGIWMYTYNGRLHLNPKHKRIQSQLSMLHEKIITFGLQQLIVRDSIDRKVLYSFDLITGAVLKLQTLHMTEILICRLSTIGNKIDEHYLALIDQNNNLFISIIRSNSVECQIYKIGTQVTAIMWSTSSNILLGLHESYYRIWYCPGESAADPTLAALTTSTYDTSEFGRNVTLESFEGPIILFKSTGILYTIQINAHCEIIHRFINEDQWVPALKLCRYEQDRMLWAILAAIASKKNQLAISEEANSASLQIDKVHYLQHIKNFPNGSAEQLAENSLIMGRIREAVKILIHNQKIMEAITLSMRMHHWEGALIIAGTHDIDLNVVLAEREKYLKALGKAEIIETFLKHQQKF